MLAISANSARALDILIELAKGDDEPLSVAAIVARLGVEEGAAAAVLTRLRDGGLVRSRRGPKGGFRLTRPSAEITIAEIVQAVDGPLIPPEDPGALHDAFQAVLRVLAARTLRDCVDDEHAARAPVYHI